MWSETVGQVIVALIPVIGGLLYYVINKLRKQLAADVAIKDIERTAAQALLEGMSVAQDAVVRKAKELTVDGRLSIEDIQQARDLAIKHAIQIAHGPAKELLLSWSNDKFVSIIRQLLARFKGAKE